MAVAATVVLVVGALLAARALLALLAWWRAMRRMARVAASIPGPPAHPIFGNFMELTTRKLRPWFLDMAGRYGHLLRLWFGPLLVVYVTEAKDVEAVVASPGCAAKPWIVYRLMEPVLGQGMVLLNGAEHRRHRKLILPSLHRDVLAQFQPLVRLCAEELTESLAAKAATGEVFDAAPLCGVAAINATYRTLLNADDDLYEATRRQRRLVVESTNRVAELVWYRFMRPWCHPGWLFRLLDRHHGEFQRRIALYDRLILDVLDHKLARRAEPTRRQARRSFLDVILASEEGRSLGADEVFAEMKTVVAGTFATSMDLLSVVLLLLAMLPAEQARLHRELDDVLGGRDAEATDLDHLEAMERFIKEALRFWPPLPVVARKCTRDVALPSGHTLPAGCYVLLSPLATHWNPEYFPEPARFDPERFLPEAVAARPACAYLPFSAGVRSCIGERYAFMLIKTCLASLLRRYDVLPDPAGPEDVARVKMTVSVTLHPKDGCRCSTPRYTWCLCGRRAGASAAANPFPRRPAPLRRRDKDSPDSPHPHPGRRGRGTVRRGRGENGSSECKITGLPSALGAPVSVALAAGLARRRGGRAAGRAARVDGRAVFERSQEARGAAAPTAPRTAQSACVPPDPLHDAVSCPARRRHTRVQIPASDSHRQGTNTHGTTLAAAATTTATTPPRQRRRHPHESESDAAADVWVAPRRPRRPRRDGDGTHGPWPRRRWPRPPTPRRRSAPQRPPHHAAPHSASRPCRAILSLSKGVGHRP